MLSLSIVGAGATGLLSTDNQAISLFNGGVRPDTVPRMAAGRDGCVHDLDRRDDGRGDADAVLSLRHPTGGPPRRTSWVDCGRC